MSKTKRYDRSAHAMLPEHVAAREAWLASGAAGKHADRRTRRVKTRAAAKDRAMRDWR